MRVERVVVDTNVLVSAVLKPGGAPRAVVETVGSVDERLLFCRETFDELQTLLLRPKFDGYVHREDRALYLAWLETISGWVSIRGAALGCRDPDDDKFLETALMGEAGCLVTGDSDLLVMSPFRGITILQPADFLDRRD